MKIIDVVKGIVLFSVIMFNLYIITIVSYLVFLPNILSEIGNCVAIVGIVGSVIGIDIAVFRLIKLDSLKGEKK